MKYTTIQGDTWDVIALKTTGSEMNMNRLIENNITHRDTVIFGAGIVLDIPDIPTAVNELLPPWKR